MALPFQKFLAYCTEQDFLVAILPNRGQDACQVQVAKRVIFLGGQLDLVDLGIIGFHELGHALVMQKHEFLLKLVDLDKTSVEHQYVKYAYELAAWAWAETQIPPGFERETQRIKTEALETYRHLDLPANKGVPPLDISF